VRRDGVRHWVLPRLLVRVGVPDGAGEGEDLSDGKRAAADVLARQSNTGFTYFTPDNRVLKNGGPPVLLEPVQAT